MPNPIEAAVAPLKADAIIRAEQEARKRIELVRTELEAAGNDLQICAPYPRSGSQLSKAKPTRWNCLAWK